jgi:uncharacterized protein YwgA
MNRLQRAALLSLLANKMQAVGSWCGERHLQKVVYISQELLGVPTGYSFTLYKQRPFSFDLQDDLTGFCADGILSIQASEPPFGPRFRVTEVGDRLQEVFSKTINNYNGKIQFVVNKLGAKGVFELEKVATALYVTKKLGSETSIEKRIEEIKSIESSMAGEEVILEFDALNSEAHLLRLELDRGRN